MTQTLVAFGRWSLTPGALLLEMIRAGDCGSPKTSGRPNQGSPNTGTTEYTVVGHDIFELNLHLYRLYSHL